MIHILALLIFAHAVADYPLQGEFLAKAKNRMMPIPGFPFWQAQLRPARKAHGKAGRCWPRHS